MRKPFGIIIAAILLFLITGCSFNSKTASPKEPWDDSKLLRPVKLTFFIPAAESERFSEIKKKISQGAKKKLNVELDFIFTGSDNIFYQNMLVQQLNSGTDIDVFITYDAYLGGLVNRSEVADITGLFPRFAPTYSSMFTREELAPATYNGRLMALPQRMLPEMKRIYAVVRDDLLAKYKISKINNFIDYENFLDKVKCNEKSVTPLLTYNTSLSLFAENYGYVIFDYGFGLVYRWNDPKMKLMAWEQTPEYREAINTLNRWKSKGYINNVITDEPIYIDSEITGGAYASFLRPYGTAEYYNKLLEKENAVTWRYREFDLYPGKKSQRVTNSGPMIAFNRNSPDVKRALMFMEWLQTDREAYNTMMYGIKGKDYIMDSKKRPVLPENYSEEYSYSSWSGKSFFYNYNNEVPDTTELKQYRNNIAVKSDYVPHLGFHIDQKSLFELIGSFNIQRDTFALEKLIDSGNFKEEDVNEHIEQQSSLISFIMIEMQRQLEIWKTSN